MNENQTTYPTGAQDEEEIDLVALMVTLQAQAHPADRGCLCCALWRCGRCAGRKGWQHLG